MPGLEQELKEGFDKIQTEIKQMRDENDKRIAKLEKGGATSELEAKIAKYDEAIEKLEEKLEQQHAALQRANSSDNPNNDEKTARELGQKMKTIFNSHLRGKHISTEEREFYMKNLPEELKTLSVGSDVDGGYFVLPERSAEINKKVFESSPLRQLADVVSIGSDAWEEVYDYSEVSTENAGETSSHSDTDTPQFGILRIPVHQMQAKPKATLKILEDGAIDLESYLAMQAAEKFGRDEATDFIAGTGVNESKGILSYDNGTGFNQVEQVETAASGVMTGDDLIEIQDTLFEPFQPNASWLMRRAVRSKIRKLKTGDGQYLLQTEGNLKDGFRGILLGAPIYLASDMPAFTAGNLIIAYGDFKQGYKVVDRLGISVLRDPYSSDNHVVWKFRKRVGGGVRKFQAIKLLKLKS